MSNKNGIKIPIWMPNQYYEGTDEHARPKRITFYPGYTALIGPNGAGKSTYLRQVIDYAKINHLEYFEFGATDENDHFSKGAAMCSGNMSYLAAMMSSSEGEVIMHRTGALASTIGNKVRLLKAKGYKGPFFICMDSLDSGMSYDKLYIIRRDLINLILNAEKFSGIDFYIICAVNDWEMVRDATQLNVITGKYVKIRTYESFRNFVFKNSKEELEDGEWKKAIPKIEGTESCSPEDDHRAEDH